MQTNKGSGQPARRTTSVSQSSLDRPGSSAEQTGQLSPISKRQAEDALTTGDLMKRRRMMQGDSQCNQSLKVGLSEDDIIIEDDDDKENHNSGMEPPSSPILGGRTLKYAKKHLTLDRSSDSDDFDLSKDFIKALFSNATTTSLPSSNACNKSVIAETLQGPFYNLPAHVQVMFKKYRGIDALYDWQHECLSMPQIKARENLIYALPTSGGKTLVAEILILRELLCNKKNVLFILPFVSIVQEKVWALSQFAVELSFVVEEYAGSKGGYPPRKRTRKNVIYVATIEKSSNLVNSLIAESRLNELGLIVIDELHLIGEAPRGTILESLITKLLYMEANIQIVGMSATIGNIDEVAAFMHAATFTRDFRPVKLTEYVKCGQYIGEVNPHPIQGEDWLINKRTHTFEQSDAASPSDPDMIGALAFEVIPDKSCLIFCSTKLNCENVARMLCKSLPRKLRKHKTVEKKRLIDELERDLGIDNTLRRSIMYGVAYHHAGITVDERRLIEDAFSARTLCIICCTSTLAAGINLPAERVIIRSPYIGSEFITVSRYKQMVGRAGRAGLEQKGESFLVTSRKDFTRVKTMLLSPMDKAESGLHLYDCVGLRQLLLSCISLGIANNRKQLLDLINYTFMSRQRDQMEVLRDSDNMLKDLIKMGAIESTKSDENIGPLGDITFLSTNDEEESKTPEGTTKVQICSNSKLVVTGLGQASIRGGFEVSRGRQLYGDLEDAQKCLVLRDSLHLLYLVTPYETAENMRPKVEIFSKILNQLDNTQTTTARTLGFSEAVIVKLMCGTLVKSIPKIVFNRFCLALILYDLLSGKEFSKVAIKFEVSRGMVQVLMNNTASFASNVVNFCEQLEKFWVFSDLFKGLIKRLTDSCLKDLSPLMELPLVKQGRAKQLYKAGFKTIQSIAKTDADTLVSKIDFMPRRVASQLIAAAQMILIEKVENLREEADALYAD